MTVQYHAPYANYVIRDEAWRLMFSPSGLPLVFTTRESAETRLAVMTR